MRFSSTTLALLGAFFFAAEATEPTVRGNRRVKDADVQRIANHHRTRHLGAADAECPRGPHAVDVSSSLSVPPALNDDGGESAWSSATRLELFRGSTVKKMVMGYAYVMYDCKTTSWFVKADLLYPIAGGLCGPGEDCDHFVKVDGERVATPKLNGDFYSTGMGWELKIPAGKAPAANGDALNLDIRVGVKKDGVTYVAGTDDENNCGLVMAKCSGSEVAGAHLSTKPSQTYYVPLKEATLFYECFVQIQSDRKLTKPPVETLISISVSTDKTVIWYDHWEDGKFDADPTKHLGTHTEVWGDGNAQNGCAPNVKAADCTNANDRLRAGDVIVIQNTVNIPSKPGVPRNSNEVRYDGGDKIMASYPIAITRGAYPRDPGSLMAGAVEVLPTTSWGKVFEAPVGTNVGLSTAPFEYTTLFFMAKEDKTIVKLPNGKTMRLDEGESGHVSVRMGQRIEATKDIQVDLITGDKNSKYEMRWYSLIAVEQFSNSYVAAVGDTAGNTKVLMYNPGKTSITVVVKHIANLYRCGYKTQLKTKYYRNRWGKVYSKKVPVKTRVCSFAGRAKKAYSKTITSKNFALTSTIHTGSGAWLDSKSPFVALSLTDTGALLVFNGKRYSTGGQWYDWGYPLVPRDELTSQVVIGLGFGCTNNDCSGLTDDRSAVWVSPLEDADFYIDFTNSGKPQKVEAVNALESKKITDPEDDDMSGALIYATKKGQGENGEPVDFAAAWGQDPKVSQAEQKRSLDLGTTVLPMTIVDVTKTADKTVVAPGQTLTYTITIANVGHKKIMAGGLTLTDQLDPDVSYVAGSMVVGTLLVEDKGSFPLGSGYSVPVDLARRGGSVEVKFSVVVSTQSTKKQIENAGILAGEGKEYPFKLETPIRYSGIVEIQNKAYLGHNSGKTCDTIEAADYVENYLDSPLTYCFTVTNVGLSHLSNIKVLNEDVVYTKKLEKSLAPGEKTIVYLESKIKKEMKNTAKVIATPSFPNGEDIDTLDEVTDTDPSSCGLAPFKPEIIVANTVYEGHDGGVKCGTAAATESVTGLYGTKVTYCFTYTNHGNTHLRAFKLRNEKLGYKMNVPSSRILAPMESTTYFAERDIRSKQVNWVAAFGYPVFKNGRPIPGHKYWVKAVDPSAVNKLTFTADVEIHNTVYLGKDDGSKCGTPDAVEFVTDYYGADVTYCFKVINTGATSLTDINIVDDELDFKDSSLGTLAPGGSAFVSHEGQITGTLRNVASVTANPVLEDGTDIPDLDDVTDSDPSSVARRSHEPDISIDNLVYKGDRGVARCHTKHAKENVKGYKDDVVTYCFTVENTGSSHLADVVVTNEAFGITIPVGTLGPDVAKTVTYSTAIDGDLTNDAVATGNPVTESLVDIPGLGDVTATDPSSVGQIAYEPSIEVQNTVYLGEDDGGSCGTDAAKELVEGKFGDFATYCFELKNTGNTHLKDFKLKNIELSWSGSSDKILAPNESTTLSMNSPITKSLTNYVDVVATPSKEDGAPLGLQDVDDNDPSGVDRTLENASIDIKNTVYVPSSDGSKSCADSVEKVADIHGTEVQYCLVVTNDGDTTLMDVLVVDDDLEFEKELEEPLLPGDSVEITVDGKIKGSLKNKAFVRGTPATDEGTPLMGLKEVSACDPSEIEKLDFTADIDLAVTVYGGHDGGDKCGSPQALKYFEGTYGTGITYCYEVTNTGPTPLSPIDLLDKSVLFYKSWDEPLQPGVKVVTSLDAFVEQPLVNFANATGDPEMPDGRDITDLEHVAAYDSAEVGMIPLVASISIETTVYTGHDDDGAGCSTATESVSGNYGSAVTYCLEVTNTGNTSLTDVYVFDNDIIFDQELENLAPGESIVVPVKRRIDADLTNMANATATPILEDGREIPDLEEVKDSDDASVEILPHSSAVTIDNTVYLGEDDGASCGTDSASDKVTGYPDTPVTYCFKVTNSGNSYLASVVVTNPVLGEFTDSTTIGLLAPGETKTIAVPGTITESLENDAFVIANPVLKSGEDIPGAENVKSSDDSEVELEDYSPGVTITNVVYIGTPEDDKCGTPAAREFVDGMYGTPVTYCFVVKNTGDTSLTDITITNKDLDFSQSLDPLAPGENVTVTTSKPITEDLVNTAVVTGKPVTEDLEDIPNLELQTAKDDSSVEKIDYTAGISVTNTVVLGSDETKCDSDAAMESQSGIYGTSVVYCLTVKNTGDTHLDGVTLVDNEINFAEKNLGKIAPGASVSVTVPGEITTDLTNTAVAKGNPVTEDGTDIPDLEDQEHKDPSSVVYVQVKAGVKISNKVFPGDDNGMSCGTGAAVEKVEGLYGAEVTYCLEVTNIGDCYLDAIEVVNTELDYKDNSIAYLAPQESKMIPVESILSEDLINNAVVTANPCLEDGRDIPDLAIVTDKDPSEAAILKHHPSVEVMNEVYLGTDSGASCAEAVNYVENYNGAGVVYCFTVTNTGNSYLSDVVVNNNDLSFSDDSITSLPPGESATLAFSTVIDGPLTNIVNVTANPTIEDGSDIPETEDVTALDTSSVGQLEYYPGVSIDNVVYLGSSDMGAGCSSGVEQVSGKFQTNVTYCFNVTNTGDTYLSNVVIHNAELGIERLVSPLLAPGASEEMSLPHNILANLTNVAVVTANPALVSGVDISGAEDVTDSDPSEVVIEVVDGTVKKSVKPTPPDDPDKCLQDNWEAAPKEGELICAKKDVTLESITAETPATCLAGSKITVTLDANMKIVGPRRDLGWYIAVDGGDALTGTCAVNAFQDGYSYPVQSVDGSGAVVGSIAWTTNGGDGDACGDVFTSGGAALIDTPFAVELELPCVDENDDGHLDFAVCFTWRSDENDGVCDISKNIPGELTGGCYCTRYDVPNIPVEEPTPDIVPC